MIKCMFCPATFEMKEVETGFKDAKREAKAIEQLNAQAAEGEKWEHLTVTVTRHGARAEIQAGHLCPDHASAVQPGALKISL